MAVACSHFAPVKGPSAFAYISDLNQCRPDIGQRTFFDVNQSTPENQTDKQSRQVCRFLTCSSLTLWNFMKKNHPYSF